MAPSRIILPDRLANARDFGGLRTEDGAVLPRRRLVRSAVLIELPDGAADALAATFGPAVYVDLRTAREVRRDGAPRELIERGWCWEQLPLQDVADDDTGSTPADFVRRYVTALPVYLAVARRIVELVDHRPLFIGCALGKDRTGLVSAILLRWLGVDRAEILDDFDLSSRCLTERRHLLPSRWRDPARPITPVTREVCAQALAAIDALGADGAAPEQAARLRAALVEGGA